MDQPVIALMTDFGEEDFFVASVKGIIAGINPAANVIDITHSIPSFNIPAGAFVLYAAYRYFPKQTIFLVIVDPGVGSSRKILLAETEKYFFIAPDNGVLSQVLEEEGVKKIRELTNNNFFLPQQSYTFEGRDKMAPAAAWLSKGIQCEKFGPSVVKYVKKVIPKPDYKANEIYGSIAYVDKFGNLITNIPEQMLSDIRKEKVEQDLHVLLFSHGGKMSELKIPFHKNYSAVRKGQLLCLIGSLGFLEIALREDSAASVLKASQGDLVQIFIDVQAAKKGSNPCNNKR